jgi:bifunctional ADP-heptose synthase (sugar kinase/adenylyltransferase)
MKPPATLIPDRDGTLIEHVPYLRDPAASLYSLDPSPALLSAIETSDAIIVSDYAKGVVSQSTLNAILDHAKQHGKTIAIDPKPSRKLNFHGVSLITPNRHEALELAGLVEPGIGEPYPLEQVCRNIHDHYSPQLLIITLGADGMAICRKARSSKRSRPELDRSLMFRELVTP